MGRIDVDNFDYFDNVDNTEVELDDANLPSAELTNDTISLPPEELMQLKSMSTSFPNLAKLIFFTLTTKTERANKNCTGKNGKEAESAAVLEYTTKQTFSVNILGEKEHISMWCA